MRHFCDVLTCGINAAAVLQRCCINAAAVLHQCCINAAAMLQRCCINAAAMLHALLQNSLLHNSLYLLVSQQQRDYLLSLRL